MFANEDTTEEILLEIGRRVAAGRIGVRMTQAELATHAGVSKRSIERLERGRSCPGLDVFVRICQCLGYVPGFEQLLPQVNLGPVELSDGITMPKRVRKQTKKRELIWKE